MIRHLCLLGDVNKGLLSCERDRVQFEVLRRCTVERRARIRAVSSVVETRRQPGQVDAASVVHGRLDNCTRTDVFIAHAVCITSVAHNRVVCGIYRKWTGCCVAGESPGFLKALN